VATPADVANLVPKLLGSVELALRADQQDRCALQCTVRVISGSHPGPRICRSQSTPVRIAASPRYSCNARSLIPSPTEVGSTVIRYRGNAGRASRSGQGSDARPPAGSRPALSPCAHILERVRRVWHRSARRAPATDRASLTPSTIRERPSSSSAAVTGKPPPGEYPLPSTRGDAADPMSCFVKYTLGADVGRPARRTWRLHISATHDRHDTPPAIVPPA
jgi:hypothetical protein